MQGDPSTVVRAVGGGGSAARIAALEAQVEELKALVHELAGGKAKASKARKAA
jgi:hypothetical protein